MNNKKLRYLILFFILIAISINIYSDEFLIKDSSVSLLENKFFALSLIFAFILIFLILIIIFKKLNKAKIIISTQKKYLNEIFENIPNGIFVVESESLKISFWNKSNEGLYGLNESSVLNRSIFDVFSKEECCFFIKLIHKVLEENKVLTSELVFQENSINKHIKINMIPNSNNEKANIIIISEDISSLKKYQNSLIKSKEFAEAANSEKSDFIAKLSHEIRTPLNGIIGMKRLLEDSSLDIEQKEILSMLDYSAENLNSIIQDLLDISRIETSKLKIDNTVFDVKELIKNTLGNFRGLLSKKDIFVKENYDCIEKMFFGDKFRIAQIINNLLNNALKYTEKGSISIDVSCNKDLEIIISDTGIGISEDKLDKIFKTFYQIDKSDNEGRSYKGLGLGLSIVQQLLSLMGGRIFVESTKGEGSRFSISIPSKDKPGMIEPVFNDETKNNEKFYLEKGLRILVAEDEAINRIYITSFLRKQLWIVDEAKDGYEVLKKHELNNYDIIIMDIGMPKLSGIETAKAIRDMDDPNKNKIPIIALTAHSYSEDIRKCFEAGMNSFVSKPLNENLLLEEIRKINKETDFIKKNSLIK